MMKRYLAKERKLTAKERLTAYQFSLSEAQDKLANAVASLQAIIKDGPPLTKTEYIEVKPGQPGYEDAPFENTLAAEGPLTMMLNAKTYTSPWAGIVERGEYPKGLGSL